MAVEEPVRSNIQSRDIETMLQGADAEISGVEPHKPFSGRFVTRNSPDLHRRASIAASMAGKSLNAWVAEQLQSAVECGGSKTPTRAVKPTKVNGKVQRIFDSRRRRSREKTKRMQD
jgi:hypothetical protein